MTRTIQLASLPDRENLVAEGWISGTQICEVAYEGQEITCYVFQRGRAIDDADIVIKEALQRLRSEYNIPLTLKPKYVELP